jgi:hypothetical protein
MYLDREEVEWLTTKWPYLRDFLAEVILIHAEPVIEEAISGIIASESWKGLLEKVLRDLSAPGSLSERRSIAISLLSEPDELRKAIAESGKFLAADTTGFGRRLVFRRGLTRVCDLRLGGTLHFGEVWRKLDEISRRLADQQAPFKRRAIDRCSMDHFIDLAAHIRTHHGADHNLPKTVKKIEEYFERYSECCQPRSIEMAIDDDDAEGSNVSLDFSDRLQSQEYWKEIQAFYQQAEDLPDEGFYLDHLDECIRQLDDEAQKFLAVKFPNGDPPHETIADYCRRNGIDDRQFRRVISEAMDRLRDYFAKMSPN